LDSYRVLSAQMGSPVWQINATALTDFVNECPEFLDTTYVINDVFVKEREVKAMEITKIIFFSKIIIYLKYP
jgi:hypothetical protein